MDKRKKKYIRLVIDDNGADIIEEDMTNEELYDRMDHLADKVNELSDILYELLNTAGYTNTGFDIMKDDERF